METRWLLAVLAGLLVSSWPAQSAVSVQGSSADAGYNAGSTAVIRAHLDGAHDVKGYDVWAEVKYAGAASLTHVELRPSAASASAPKPAEFEGHWPIPENAPTGLYTLTIHAGQRASKEAAASATAPSFVVYRKRVRIARVTLDRAFYAPGDRIECEVAIENRTGEAIKGLRVEFSNENYPWISTFSGSSANAPSRMAVDPSLGLTVLRDSLDLAPHAQANLAMQPAGTAAFLQGSQVAVMGAGGPARHESVASPEVDRYTIAVWDHDRRELLDMQFSPQVVVRDPGRVLPKPYDRNFTHPYNDEIDFSKYREFYPLGENSDVIALVRGRSLYRPGDLVSLKATVKALLAGSGPLHLEVRDAQGQALRSADLSDAVRSASGEYSLPNVWQIPATAAPGVYTLTLSEREPGGRDLAAASTEIAVNSLPASLMVFCPHEDDEHPWAGLMRAMVEAGLPVEVVFYTGGDVGECERYFDGHPCDPVRAREFGTVRMEESAEALEHIGVKREHATFLGLPDGGSGEIWFHHRAPADPFRSIYLAVDHAPYENAVVPNLPFARDAVEDTVKRLIIQFHPAMIAVSHPDERHVDHRTANWFTLKACQELMREKRIDPATIVLGDQAYGSGGFKPAPYRYEKYDVSLSGEAAALKQEMSWIYQSQDGNLEEGARHTESELPRVEHHLRIVDWSEHEGWNE